MAQYVPFAEGVDVSGGAVLSFANAAPAFRDNMLQVLANNGIKDIQPDGWYSQIQWLNAMKEVNETYGTNTLFIIGKAIPKSVEFPPDIDTLEKALAAIDITYHMNHRNGEIGHYTLASFNQKERLAIMECNNPYPSSFDQGIVTAIARKFIPPRAPKIDVELDSSKPTRSNGADQCTYLVSW